MVLVDAKFVKGSIMLGFTKYKTLKFLTVFAIVMTAWAVAAAENAELASEKKVLKEVLTPLEQRMMKKVSVDFRNMPIEDVLRIMAEQADVDIVKSPKVTGSVTATLTDVPLEEALSNILAAHGYGYVTGKNMIRIAPVGEIAEKSERLVSRIYRIHYADVSEVEKALKKFVSKRGSLSSNPGTSNIIVTDAESKIKAIDTFINEIDRITPQILVEARIYDITSKDRFDLGVQWQAGRNTTIASTLGSNPTAGRTDPFMKGTFSSKAGETSTSTGTMRFGWFNSAIDIDVLLKAQQENVNAKLLANPRVLVLDNEKAVFKIISEIPYQELTETSEGGSMGSTSFREVGVELEVTPHLTRDGMVRLYLKPEFSVQTGEVELGTGASTTFDQPVIDRRVAETTLLVKDGHTVVLGGLRKKEVNQQIDKIPLLGDLPLLGELFRFKGEETIVSELVVFITPRIVSSSVLAETDKQAYEATEFSGPKPTLTKAEKAK